MECYAHVPYVGAGGHASADGPSGVDILDLARQNAVRDVVDEAAHVLAHRLQVQALN